MTNTETFEVKSAHLELLRRACVGWNDAEFGAPEINPKRPYGNSNVAKDIAEILGITLAEGRDEYPWYGHLVTELAALHRETETVLQIALRVGYFKAGKYECDKYTRDWRPVDA